MITVGIYGRIGSGKSEVAKVFAEHGAAVISADQIGKQVVDQNVSVLKALVDAFGEEIVDSNGHLKRRDLGRIAFSSAENRARLDSIVHPPLLDNLQAKINEYRKSKLQSIIVVDAALILNWGLESELDILVCVTAPESSQIERMARYGLSAHESEDRLNSQIPADQQALRADFVIDNSGTLEDLRAEATRVLDQIKRQEKTD
jgi:dephospho-CoA kinase